MKVMTYRTIYNSHLTLPWIIYHLLRTFFMHLGGLFRKYYLIVMFWWIIDDDQTRYAKENQRQGTLCLEQYHTEERSS